MSLPEGWFPDQSDPTREVHWDGQRWTGETRPAESPAPAVATAQQPDAAPTEAAKASGRLPKNRRRLLIAGGLVVLLVAAGITTGVLVDAHNHQVAAATAKAAAKKKAEAAANRAEAVANAKQAADDAARTVRKGEVTSIEASVKKLAEDDVAKGLLDGPILSASCNPVSGSYDVLTDQTTTFNCFVANKDNGDGTFNGYNFNATINWNSGDYTYGLGKAS